MVSGNMDGETTRLSFQSLTVRRDSVESGWTMALRNKFMAERDLDFYASLGDADSGGFNQGVPPCACQRAGF